MKIASVLNRFKEMGQLLAKGGPGVCNIAITNACNARCDFCNYAYDKPFVQQKAMVGFQELCEAIDVLYERGIRYLTFSGGEPLLHPRLKEMVAYAVGKGMRPSICTNGFLLTPRMIRDLKESGLKTLIISIDAASAKEHEENRGLPGVCARIKEANGELKRLSIKTVASVTINRLIKEYARLLLFLKELGFETATFSYPKRALGSSSLVFSETSSLIDYTPEELIKAFEEIKGLKGRFSILNPGESLSEMVRFLKKEEQLFPCFGGYKYFFLDWNLDLYRCDFWPTKMGSIYEFRDTPFIRDNCTLCMSDCYRDSSVLLHFAVSLGDTIGHLKRGELARAMRTILTRSNARSVKALVQEWGTFRRLAKRG
ncbi:MAG: radical SAM protein [Candidatus Methylomirabilales bacterium]